MATETPPPYFPQGSLAPPDPKRYRKFKLIVALVVGCVLLVLVGLAAAVYYFLQAALR